MIRFSSSLLRRLGVIVCSGLLGSGCAALREDRETIIRVESPRQTEKAQRLTLAGIKAMQLGELDHAYAKFTAALAADEQYGPAHSNLGLWHYDRGELYDAILSFERATELMPRDPIVFYNLGLALEAGGRVDEAMDLYWRAVEMDPSNPNFLGNLVRLRVRLGENSPEVIAQLQDLVLIETRPDWRQWADRQLALDMNPLLDRGPDAPEFRTDRPSDRQGRAVPTKRVIDLTPKTPSPSSETRNHHDRRLDSRDVEDRATEAGIPEPSAIPAEPLPEPIQDKGSLEILPPSINGSPVLGD